MPVTRKRWISFVVWIVASNLAGLIGAAATMRAGGFYRTLDRPEWAPPSWLFGPVWTLLYVLMGIAAARVATNPEPGLEARKRTAIRWFVAQLAVNALWSWIFFAWHLGALAFAEIVLLAVMIVATMRAFARVDRLAALLLVPYLAWVLFATALTLAIWRRNLNAL